MHYGKKSIQLLFPAIFIISSWTSLLSAQQLDQISSGDSKFDALEIPRRLIAIDNVCAWPNLSVLPDGTIIASIFNQPSHAKVEGDIECWASEDEGLTWAYRGTPTRHEPNTSRHNAAAGVKANGELIVLASGIDQLKQDRLEATISVSKDGGKTWERGGTMPPRVRGLSHHTPFGDIIVADNGDLVVGTYVNKFGPEPIKKGQPKKYQAHKYAYEGHVYALRSKDEGKTWTHVTPIVKDIHVEAAMLHLGDGKWLAASRRFGFRDLDLHVSTDDGFTWNLIENHGIGIPRVSAAHLLKLSDGRVLLTYGNRSPGNKGIDVRISEDEGKSWSAPQRIINLPGSGDTGYPAAIELAGGRMMIAYYTNGIPQHDRYHMGVVNFLLDELVVRLPE